MQNTTFRIAFWALFISLGLCLTAAVVSPQAHLAFTRPPATMPHQEGFVMAEYPRIQLGPPQAFPADWRVASADDGIVPHITIAPPTPAPQSTDAPTPQAVERRVPSPYEPALLSPPPAEWAPQPEQAHRQTLITPEHTSQFAPRVAENSFETAELSETSVRRGFYEELPPPPLELLEPAIVHATPESFYPKPDDELRTEVHELRREMTRLELLQLRRDLDQMKRTIARPENELRADAATPWLPLKPSLLANLSEQTATALGSASEANPTTTGDNAGDTADHAMIMRSSPSETEKRWTFEFQNAPLGEALIMLGEHAGKEIVVEAGTAGLLTHTFADADPNQAFASVVKSFGLGVDVRGDYIFVRRSVVVP